MKDEENHFTPLFWFCVGLILACLIFLAGLIWIPVPKEKESMSNVVFGFITALANTATGFILGGLIPQKKAGNSATGTAEINATLKTEQ